MIRLCCFRVKVRIPGPKILSLEARSVSVGDKLRWYNFWKTLNDGDRNAVMAEMFTEARNHVADVGGPLLDEARQRLEGGLRAIMPAHVKSLDFDWQDNPEAFDFEWRRGNAGISKLQEELENGK